MRVLVPVVKTRDGRLLLSPHFGGAMLYVILEVNDECKVVDELEIGTTQPGGRGRLVIPWALQRGVKAVVAREVGWGVYEGFTAAGVRICYAESLDPCEAAKACVQGKAREITPEDVAAHAGRGRGMHRHGYQGGPSPYTW